MKRIYIAVVFIILSVIIGAIEYGTISVKVDEYLSKIQKAELLTKQGNYEKAEELSKQTAEDFDKYSKAVLYCYYRHDDLEEIIETLYNLEDLLDDKKAEDYHEANHTLKEKLLSIKEKEHITIQNIL